MPKNDMNAMLKRRMSAAQQASELQVSDEAYQQIFQRAPPLAPTEICELPLDKLDPFFTADIGFKPYSPSKLKAFAEQLQEEGLLIRIIVRRIPGSDRYEILAGHNRTAAARLAGWTKIAAEVVAVFTNLLLSPLVFSSTGPDFQRKVACVSTMLESIGLPLINDQVSAAFSAMGAVLYGEERT